MVDRGRPGGRDRSERSPGLPVRLPRRDASEAAPASGVSRPSGRAPPDGSRGSLPLRWLLGVVDGVVFVLVSVFGLSVVGCVFVGVFVSGDVGVDIVLGAVVATLFLLFFFFLFFLSFLFFFFFFFVFFLLPFRRFAFAVLWRDLCGVIASSLDAESTASDATGGAGSPTPGAYGGGSCRP